MSQRSLDAALLSDRLDWNLLRTFLTIAHERSISRAAVRLHLTQPAVSLALKRLEDQLGATLVERHRQRFQLTQIGEDTLRIATDVYGHVARLGSELDEGREDVSGAVRLLVASGIRSGVYDECLAAFHRQHDRVELQLEVMLSADIIETLTRKRAGVGLSLCRNPVDNLERQLFQQQRWAIYCGRHHRLFGRTDLALRDLRSEDIVSFTSDQLGGELSPLAVFRDQQGFTGRIVATSSSVDEIKRLIFGGYGVGYLAEHSVADDLAQGRLWRLPPEEGVADIAIYLLWNRQRRLTAAEAAFIEHFRRYVALYSLPERLGTVVNAPLAGLRRSQKVP